MLEILQEDISLRHDVLHLISLHDGLLLQHLDGIVLPGRLVLT